MIESIRGSFFIGSHDIMCKTNLNFTHNGDNNVMKNKKINLTMKFQNYALFTLEGINRRC